MTLTLFTQPSTLQSIGYNRITKFLLGFTDDLRGANLPALLVEQPNGNYVDHLAAFLADLSPLPERLRNTLLTLENAASETNHHALESIIQRRLGDSSLTGCPLDRALEVWFTAPEELSQFDPTLNLDHNLTLNLNPQPSQIENSLSLSSVPNGGESQGEEEPENRIQNPTSETSSPERGFPTRSNAEPATAPDADNTTREQPASLTQIEDALSQSLNPIPITNSEDTPEASASFLSQIEIQKSKIKNDLPLSSSPEERAGVRSRPPENQRIEMQQSDKATDSSPSQIENSFIKNEDDLVFLRLARLTLADYDRVRNQEAQKLRIRAETLDREVARFRAELEYQASVQSALEKIPACEPWPEPITDAPALFHEVAGRYTRYLVLPTGAADAFALWTGDTYVFDAFIQSPRLNLSSPIEGCGKSTAIDVLATMVRRPFQSENLRAAVLFRIVDQIQPTLLLDEVDTYCSTSNKSSRNPTFLSSLRKNW